MCEKLGKKEGLLLDDLKILAHHDSSEVTSGYLKDKKDERLQEVFGIKITTWSLPFEFYLIIDILKPLYNNTFQTPTLGNFYNLQRYFTQ